MPVLQFKGKTAVECYHHGVPHHTLEIDPKLSLLGKGEKPGLNGNQKVDSIDGTFAYPRLVPPLFGEYRDFGRKLPSFEDLAKYIFCIETSRDFDATKVNVMTGKIGEHAGTSYFMPYTPNGTEDQALDSAWLHATVKTDKDKQLVIYCEKIWIHRDDLARFEQETGCKVRPMLVPFNLK